MEVMEEISSERQPSDRLTLALSDIKRKVEVILQLILEITRPVQ